VDGCQKCLNPPPVSPAAASTSGELEAL